MHLPCKGKVALQRLSEHQSTCVQAELPAQINGGTKMKVQYKCDEMKKK